MSQLRLSLVPSKLPHKRKSLLFSKAQKTTLPSPSGSRDCVLPLPFTHPSYELLVNVMDNVFTSLSVLSFVRHDRVTGHSSLFQRTPSEEWKYLVPTSYDTVGQECQARSWTTATQGMVRLGEGSKEAIR